MNYIMIAKIVLPVILAALIIGKRKFLSTIPISGYAYVMAWLLVGLTYGCLWISHYLLAFLGFNVHWEELISDNGKNGADCYSKNGHAVTDLTRQS